MSRNESPTLRIPHAILTAALLVGFAGLAGMIVSIWDLTSTPESAAPEPVPVVQSARSPAGPKPGVWRPSPSLPSASARTITSDSSDEPRPPPVFIAASDATVLHEQQMAELRRQAADPSSDPDSRLTEERMARMEAEGLMVW